MKPLHFLSLGLLVSVGLGIGGWMLSGRPAADQVGEPRTAPTQLSLAAALPQSSGRQMDARPSLPVRSSLGTGNGEVGGTKPGPVPTVIERFRQISGEAMAALPRASELMDLSEEELHSRPLPLQRAGAALGRIAQALQADSELKMEGIRFYTECAEKPELLQTVRALCYRDLASLGGLDSDVAVPDAVKRLAREIP